MSQYHQNGVPRPRVPNKNVAMGPDNLEHLGDMYLSLFIIHDIIYTRITSSFAAVFISKLPKVENL